MFQYRNLPLCIQESLIPSHGHVFQFHMLLGNATSMFILFAEQGFSVKLSVHTLGVL
jgi:hypothetical protein